MREIKYNPEKSRHKPTSFHFPPYQHQICSIISKNIYKIIKQRLHFCVSQPNQPKKG